MTMGKVVMIGGKQINCATEPHKLTSYTSFASLLFSTRQAVKASALARGPFIPYPMYAENVRSYTQ